jgi:hypothetical protein
VNILKKVAKKKVANWQNVGNTGKETLYEYVFVQSSMRITSRSFNCVGKIL